MNERQMYLDRLVERSKKQAVKYIRRWLTEMGVCQLLKAEALSLQGLAEICSPNPRAMLAPLPLSQLSSYLASDSSKLGSQVKSSSTHGESGRSWGS